jgi:very-short-patch-repair endonuclease
VKTPPPNPLSNFGEGGPDASEFTDLEPSRSWQTGYSTWARLKPSIKELRENATPAEKRLWSALRNRQLNGSRWRRQHAIDGFVVDFYCSSAGLAVEVDGEIHKQQVQNDRSGQEVIERRNLTVLRFRNDEVMNDLPNVLSQLLEAIVSPSPKSERGPGGEVCA